MAYTPGGGGEAIALTQVVDVDDEGVHLCPAPCVAVEADEDPPIEIHYGCG